MEYTLIEYTKDEQEADMRKELEKNGLYNCVKFRCDLIDEECKNLSYIPHRTVQEYMCEIMKLIELTKQSLSEWYKQVQEEAKKDFQNSEYWNDYLAEIIGKTRSDTIEEFVNHLERCEALGMVDIKDICEVAYILKNKC